MKIYEITNEGWLDTMLGKDEMHTTSNHSLPKPTKIPTFIKSLAGTAMLWYALFNGISLVGDHKLIDDAIKEYEITVRHGSPVEKYTHANLVAAAMLRAHNEEGYKKWKQIADMEERIWRGSNQK